MHPDIKLLFDNCFVSKYNSCTLQVSILNIREGFFVKESRLRLRSAGLLSVAAGFMLFLYAPLEIYFNNKYEFWFDFYDLIPLCLLMFAVFTGVSFLLAFIVSKINTRLYHGFLTVYLIAFLCTYIQGNFMIGNLPHLDGSTVDWAQYSGLRIGSVALWVAVTVLVILAVKKLSLTKGSRCSRYCQRADQSGSVGDSCNARVHKTGPGTQIFYDQHHLWGTGNVYRSKPCTSGSGHSRRRHHVTGDRTPSRI